MTTMQRVTAGNVGVAVPEDWEARLDVLAGVPFVAIAPSTPVPFRSSAVVTVGDVLEAMTFREWQAGTDEILPTSLQSYQLLDMEPVTVSGLKGVRRLAHHVTPDGVGVTMQQWAVLTEGHGVTLTVTVPTAELGALTEIVDEIGRSLSVEEKWAS
jgi:hypothetical protein